MYSNANTTKVGGHATRSQARHGARMVSTPSTEHPKAGNAATQVAPVQIQF